MDLNVDYLSKRNCHTSVIFKHYMIIFGGKEGYGQKKSMRDIHIFDIKNLGWINDVECIGIVPDVRMGHSADIYEENKMVVYGGWNGTRVLNDVPVLIMKENDKREQSSPPHTTF